MNEIDWPSIAAQLYQATTAAGCRCQFETSGGVPQWFKDPTTGALGRRLVHKCSIHVAREVYEQAVGLKPEQAQL